MPLPSNGSGIFSNLLHGASIGSIFGGGTTGEVANGFFGSLVDPANYTGFFGKNVGPGAFLDPNGEGGSFLPGQSFGAKGVLGINPHLGIVGPVGNTVGAAVAGGGAYQGIAGMIARMLQGVTNTNYNQGQ